MLCLYVDDMLIISSTRDIIQQVKNMLHSQFNMKDMGLGNVILSIKITKTPDEIILSQDHYAEKIKYLRSLKTTQVELQKSPLDTQLHLIEHADESMS